MPPAGGGDGAIVGSLLEASQGTLWIGTGGALYRREPDGRTCGYTWEMGCLPLLDSFRRSSRTVKGASGSAPR
jgi:hypothetical protein